MTVTQMMATPPTTPPTMAAVLLEPSGDDLFPSDGEAVWLASDVGWVADDGTPEDGTEIGENVSVEGDVVDSGVVASVGVVMKVVAVIDVGVSAVVMGSLNNVSTVATLPQAM